MSDVDPADLDLATLAWLAGAAANEHLLAEIRAAGHPRLRIAHGYVFQLLLDDTPTVGEIAAALGVTQQAASKAVRELEGLGYLRREGDESDQRVRRVVLTDAGRDAVEAARAARARLEERLAKGADVRTLRAARRVLLRLLEETGGASAVSGRRVRSPSL